MLSEKIIFALNNVDDSFLEEANELFDRPAATQHAVNKRTIHIFLIAAVIALLLAACAIGYSIHQRRQQELRENLKIEENHVAGYKEFEEAPTPDKTATESEGKTPSIQLISTFREGEFADVYFSISPITREEAWDAIGLEHKNAIYVIASNSSKLDDAYREIEKDKKGLYARYPVLPPIHVDEYLRPQETREELLAKYYDADTQSLMLKTEFLLNYEAIDWSKPVYMNVKIIEMASLATSFDEPIEEFWARYDPVCIRDYGTIPVSITDTEYISADFGEDGILVTVPSDNKVLRVLRVNIYPAQVEWQVTHEDADLIFNLPRDDDEAFHRGYDQLLEWLAIYDQVLDGSALILEDGTRVKLNPSESTPYEDGVVSLYSRWQSTIDLRAVRAIDILGQTIPIYNPFRDSKE
ncbi:MAG: hypothetical protein IKS55_02895 [Oscillospiraceae bacterium]|nr:hypothetical protein [Oscillospiraceae bacterium]